ncbi:MAG: ABC transporter ATP-binding protein [Candidatus Atribacteria bacterium]|nr:ABC transporter ATP-binding protein [Candidatus Atribacteria bacterium]
MVKPILSTCKLKKLFPVGRGVWNKPKAYVNALDKVDLDIMGCTTFGLLGESGCGKTTLAQLITRLQEPTSGTIWYKGHDITKMKGRDLRENRIYSQIQIVFQNPAEVLSPRRTIDFLLKEPLKINKVYEKEIEIEQKIEELLDKVNLRPELLTRFPHQLSGGQQQRICIARALSLNPDFIVLDEPTSALDVSVQAKILNLLVELQQKERLTYLLVTHDIRVAEYICTDIAVMYLGEIVEILKAEEFRQNAKHPYSKLLIESANTECEEKDFDLKVLDDPPSPINLPKGCRFQARCPVSIPICSTIHPELKKISDGTKCRCHRVTDN